MSERTLTATELAELVRDRPEELTLVVAEGRDWDGDLDHWTVHGDGRLVFVPWLPVLGGGGRWGDAAELRTSPERAQVVFRQALALGVATMRDVSLEASAHPMHSILHLTLMHAGREFAASAVGGGKHALVDIAATVWEEFAVCGLLLPDGMRGWTTTDAFEGCVDLERAGPDGDGGPRGRDRHRGTPGSELIYVLALRGGARAGCGSAAALVDWAQHAIACGIDRPATCRLAGASQPHHSLEVDEMFTEVLDELGLPEPASVSEILDAELISASKRFLAGEILWQELLATADKRPEGAMRDLRREWRFLADDVWSLDCGEPPLAQRSPGAWRRSRPRA